MTLFSTPLFVFKDKRAHIHIPRSIRLDNGGSAFYVPVAMVDRGFGARCSELIELTSVSLLGNSDWLISALGLYG